MATPRRFGYRAARVPKAGACQRLVPNPMMATANPMSHTQGLMPMRKYPVPTINMLMVRSHATRLRYMSANIPAGTLATPEEMELMANMAPYATSPRPKVARIDGIIRSNAPCPKCLMPCPAERPYISVGDFSPSKTGAAGGTMGGDSAGTGLVADMMKG